MNRKRDSAVQVQVHYQPDPQRQVRALLLLLETRTTAPAYDEDVDWIANKVLNELNGVNHESKR